MKTVVSSKHPVDLIRSRLNPETRIALCCLIFGSIALSYFVVLTIAVAGDGSRPEPIGCTSVMNWDIYSTCGVNVQNCYPLTSSWNRFRCPRSCMSAYAPLTPIGSGPYRSDSGICLAALHSGAISAQGGCFMARRSGPAKFFKKSTSNGVTTGIIPYDDRHNFPIDIPLLIETEEFPAPFPLTYEVAPDHDSKNCTDLGFPIILPTLLIAFMALILIGMSERFIWIALVVNGAIYSAGPISQNQSIGLVSAQLQNCIVPLIIVCWLLWDHGGSDHFVGVEHAPVHLFMFYIFPFFIVMHMDYIHAINRNLDLILDKRLLKVRNAYSLMFIGSLLIGCVIALVYLIKRARRHLKLWPTMVRQCQFVIPIITAIVFFGLSIPDASIHVHHYIFGLCGWGLVALSLPANRYTMIMQSVLLALIVNGVAIWGMAPPYDIGDGPVEPVQSSWKPNIQLKNIANSSDDLIPIGTSWVPAHGGNVTIYSIKFNDVEVYRGSDSRFTMPQVETGDRYVHNVCVSQVSRETVHSCEGRLEFRFRRNPTAYGSDNTTHPTIEIVIKESLDQL